MDDVTKLPTLQKYLLNIGWGILNMTDVALFQDVALTKVPKLKFLIIIGEAKFQV